jgi:hypothetical protein
LPDLVQVYLYPDDTATTPALAQAVPVLGVAASLEIGAKTKAMLATTAIAILL